MTFPGSRLTFTPDNTYNGRRIGDMTEEEKQRLKDTDAEAEEREICKSFLPSSCSRAQHI